MVATLQSRKEAIEAKIIEKNEELKKLCLQEADLTGVIPPEIPLEPGEPPPPVRRRVGTSFSFPQNLLNNIKDADEESLIALEVECKVQTNIAEAALTLANDTTVNKAARRKHRLMYRQSQRRLSELEARLNLLKQGKADQSKPQQVKKKPRPNTTAVENIGYLWNKAQNQIDNTQFNGSNSIPWQNKRIMGYSASDEADSNKEFSSGDLFGSLHRSYKSSGTSHGSNSPRVDVDSEDSKSQCVNNSHMSNQFLLASSFASIQDVAINKPNKTSNIVAHHKKSPKKGLVRRQWDTQSAGGTLLPNQTYPDHSHQPNLSRTQSLSSVEANSQRSGKITWNAKDFPLDGNSSKEKEWYETALDSAPSPPLRTSSRLPTTARMLNQMQELQSREWNGFGLANLQPSNSQPALSATPNALHRNIVRSVSAYQTSDSAVNEDLITSVQQMNLNLNPPKGKFINYHVNDNGCVSQNDFNFKQNHTGNKYLHDYSQHNDNFIYQSDQNQNPDMDVASDQKFSQYDKLLMVRQNSLTLHKFKRNKYDDPDALFRKQEVFPESNYRVNDTVYINIPEEHTETIPNINNWINDGESVKNEFRTKPKMPTQPYYHLSKLNYQSEKIENLQYQAARNRQSAVDEQHQTSLHHPAHAVTQNEITFDTVVPFESPQNHTVVQAGKWQPYREVTKPFEMSDFYKYSTKFRQNNCNGVKIMAHNNRAHTPEINRNSPNTQHQKAIYTPLRPMTCQPIETKSNQLTIAQNQLESHFEDEINQLVEVSLPEIV